MSEGGPIAYSTGIAEVALPIEFKLRNIEATEKAQKRAMETAGKRGERPEDIGASPLRLGAGCLVWGSQHPVRGLGIGWLQNRDAHSIYTNKQPLTARPAATVGNLTNNYFHHRREHAIEMRAREGKPAGACVCLRVCVPPFVKACVWVLTNDNLVSRWAVALGSWLLAPRLSKPASRLFMHIFLTHADPPPPPRRVPAAGRGGAAGEGGHDGRPGLPALPQAQPPVTN